MCVAFNIVTVLCIMMGSCIMMMSTVCGISLWLQEIVLTVSVTLCFSSFCQPEQDELLELRLKKQRGHTISVMTPAEANRQHEEAGLRAGAGGKDAVGQVTPAQVFLQLYHTHPLIMDSQDLPLHVPNNEVGRLCDACL